jgi:hypothetical protein
MRTKKIIILGLLAITIITILYVLLIDSLPPRTPQKVARLISGLSIPHNAKVLEFKDEWNDFNGNGFSFVILSLNEDSFNKIYHEAISLQFKSLPIKEAIYGPLNNLCGRKTDGIYKIQIDSRAGTSFSGTILCKDEYKIAVYVAVN